MTAGIGAIGGVGGGIGGIAAAGAPSLGDIGSSSAAPGITPSTSVDAPAESAKVTLSETALAVKGTDAVPKAFPAGPIGSYESIGALAAPQPALPAVSLDGNLGMSQLVTFPSFDISDPLDATGKMIDSLTDMLIMMLIIHMMETVRKAAEKSSDNTTS